MHSRPLDACRCSPTHRGRPVDAVALNGGWRGVDAGRRWPFVIVPGFTPRLGWSRGLHPAAAARLEEARVVLAAGLTSTIIVSGGAVHSDENEAVLMREWLLARGVDERALLVEPCARHTTTNLRNAGRMVLAAGAKEALIVTNGLQTFYLAFPWRSGFFARCLAELGYRVGALTWLGPMAVAFRPSEKVFRASWKETRAGDP
jgi:hypothetical protein